MTLPYVQPGIMNISPYIGGETEITGIDWAVDQVQAVLWYNEKNIYINR